MTGCFSMFTVGVCALKHAVCHNNFALENVQGFFWKATILEIFIHDKSNEVNPLLNTAFTRVLHQLSVILGGHSKES